VRETENIEKITIDNFSLYEMNASKAISQAKKNPTFHFFRTFLDFQLF
jgi:hypothetical protein